jgi:tetratricopeptide (TPR) repeat protein
MKQGQISLFAVTLGALLLLTGCSRDPETVKRRYLENGNKYYSQGKYKEAVIMYKNALKHDPKFGDAYARLGDAEVRRGEFKGAVAAYRRAIELQKDAEESAGKLADIYLAAYSAEQQRDRRLIDEVQDLSQTLLRKNPNSYHGLRLKGFLAVNEATDKTQREAKLQEAIENFQKADAVRPKQAELRFALAQVYNQTGRWSDSEKLVKQILADSPTYNTAYDFLIVEYARRNRLEDAEAMLNQKVSTNPKNIDFVLQQAGFFRATNRNDRSEQIISALLARESQDPGIRQKVADYFVRIRDYDRALKLYSDGIEKDKERATRYRLSMAQVLVGQGKNKEALAVVDEALKAEPKNNDALSFRASLQLQYGGKEQQQPAINDLQTLISRAPDNVVVRYNLARAYQVRGDLDAARVQYQEAVKLQPKFIGAQVGLAQVYLTKHDYGKAIATSDEILRLDPRNVAARVIKSNSLTNSGNLREARTQLNGFLADTPDSPDLLFQLAIVDFLEGRYKDAEGIFANLRQQYPSDPRLIYAIAEVQIRTNRPAEALKFLEDELVKNPGNQDLRLAVANTALRTDRTEVAEKEYRILLEKDPKNYDIYLRLGETLRRKGQVQAALEMLKKGREIVPDNAGANLQLAMTLDSAGMKRESLPLYEAVIKFDPENPIALNNLAYMYAEEGRDLDQALTYAQRAKQRMPSNDDVADTLSWIYIKKNLNDNAITILKELVAKNPKKAVYHYHLGVALFQKGEKSAARQSLQTALTLKPDKDDAAKIKELLAKVG